MAAAAAVAVAVAAAFSPASEYSREGSEMRRGLAGTARCEVTSLSTRVEREKENERERERERRVLLTYGVFVVRNGGTMREGEGRRERGSESS